MRDHHLVQTRDDDLVTLSMAARIWSGIDGEVDNAMSVAAQEGDEMTVQGPGGTE